MSDVLLTRDGPYPAPYTYELGAREAFEPTTVEGLVDGTSAGGAFKVVCVIRSPDGKVLARVPTSETFAPGDEVAVTFAPFLRAFATAGGGVATLPSCVCSLDIGTGVFANGIHYLPITTLKTDTPSIFSTAGGGTPNVDIAEDGFYMISGRLSINPAVDCNFFLNLQGHGDGVTGWTSDLDVIPADNTRRQNVAFLGGATFSNMTATDTISLSFQNDLGIAGVDGAGLSIVRLSTSKL